MSHKEGTTGAIVELNHPTSLDTQQGDDDADGQQKRSDAMKQASSAHSRQNHAIEDAKNSANVFLSNVSNVRDALGDETAYLTAKASGCLQSAKSGATSGDRFLMDLWLKDAVKEATKAGGLNDVFLSKVTQVRDALGDETAYHTAKASGCLESAERAETETESEIVCDVTNVQVSPMQQSLPKKRALSSLEEKLTCTRKRVMSVDTTSLPHKKKRLERAKTITTTSNCIMRIKIANLRGKK